MIDLDTISALIVEANPNMRTQLRNMLNMSGIAKVQFAVSAGVAVRKLRDSRFDLILCEYHIGDGQDGQHLLEDLRHNGIIPLSTLFVMVTGERQYERVVSAAELAPNDYILKPFAADTLHERILRALDKRDAFMPVYRLIEVGNVPDAIATCAEAEGKYPQWALDFLRLRAELQVASGQADAAQRLYERILETRSVPWARLGLAKTLFMQKRYDEASDMLQALVNENDLFVDAYDWLARTREAAGNLESARHILANATALSPHRIGRLRRLGELSIETGDHEEAERILSEVVRKGKYSDFRDPEDHVRLLQAQLGKGDTTQAEATIRDLERSMAGLDKTRSCSTLSSALVHVKKGDTQRAGEALKTLLAEQGAAQALSPKLKGELARACFASQLDDHGAEVVLDIMRNAPDERSVEKTKAMLKEVGKENLGEQLAGQIDGEVRDLVSEGARKAQSGDFDGAVQFMLSAVRRMPGNTHVLFNATLALLKHIEHCGWNERFAEQARGMMERARLQDPGSSRLPALTAYYYNLLKKYGIQA
ncbi:tetratricopeptide repeat protein [Zoogloea sp.]|uniref:tetratricopeptide repeat protein n=1 Tax=Zoogloea sp. TaxID=49181 RepID=UPI0035AE72FB